VNDAFHRHTGFSREEVLGQPLQMLKGPLTDNSELYRIGLALVQSQPIRTELIIYKKNDEPLWMELDIVPVDYLGRGLTHWVSVARDITDRKKAEDEIEHLAFYDVLTKLPNRQLLMKRLEHALVKSANTRKIGSLMFIDLDNFKILNDTLGHSKGDLLLQQVAARLSKCIRKSDTVARLGGDEFVVMLEDLGDSPKEAVETSRTIGEAVLAALSEPYDLLDYQHYGTCSIGVTSFSRDRQNIGDLLKQADLAMYQAKAAGRNSVCFFDPQMQAAANASAVMSSELRQALRNQEFVLHYQPQVGLDGMFGVEALVRWLHPERGLIYPGEFIAQAEESGLILPLGQWVMETACAQLASWAGRPETHKLRIAVNVSVRQFRHPQFVDSVMRVINESAISADRLKLELTESLLAHDMDVTIAKMGLLKAAGVTLSIDDFGIGYSALSYLKHLPLDQLKIDRSFVKDILRDPNDAAIARTIIGLARSLGLGVVAEGVETIAQRELLSQFGCDCYQGHLFCKALAIDDLEIFMSKLA
jgi:diguanylate cyclase (GGDEF)-like protein/PAS domain S-box-containing protein